MTTMTIKNLGKALSCIVRHEAREAFMHADVAIMHAPSECHSLVARGEDKRLRIARKAAEAVAQRPFRVIRREAAKRGCALGSPAYQAAVGRYYARTFPF